jgi:hypothetical protein
MAPNSEAGSSGVQLARIENMQMSVRGGNASFKGRALVVYDGEPYVLGVESSRGWFKKASLPSTDNLTLLDTGLNDTPVEAPSNMIDAVVVNDTVYCVTTAGQILAWSFIDKQGDFNSVFFQPGKSFKAVGYDPLTARLVVYDDTAKSLYTFDPAAPGAGLTLFAGSGDGTSAGSTNNYTYNTHPAAQARFEQVNSIVADPVTPGAMWLLDQDYDTGYSLIRRIKLQS